MSDHAPLLINIPKFVQPFPSSKKTISKESDAETQFFADILSGVKSLNTSQLIRSEDLEMTCNSLQTIVATAWNKHAKTKLISVRSKSWWNLPLS